MEGGTTPRTLLELLLGICGTGIPSSMLLEKLPDDPDESVARLEGIGPPDEDPRSDTISDFTGEGPTTSDVEILDI